MRRRSFLRVAGATATLVACGGRAGATTQTEFAPAGSVEVRNLAEAVVGPDGETAYLAVDTGFVVVDVADPASPTVLSERRDLAGGEDQKPFEGIRDVSVSGDRLLVAGPHQPNDARFFSGFQLFDVGDPAAPERVASVGTEHPIHNAFLDGETAYVTGTQMEREPLFVWDLSGDEPERVGEWSVLDVRPDWGSVASGIRNCHDVHVQNEVAYVANWDAGTWLLDVSDPAAPRALFEVGGRDPGDVPPDASALEEAFEVPGNSHHARPNEDGTLLAVGREAFDLDRTEQVGGPAGITIWDLDREVPEATATLAPPDLDDDGLNATAHNFAFRGDRLYTSWYSGGVRVYDVSEPSSPMLVDAWKDEAHASFWTAVPTAAGVIGASSADVSVPAEQRRQTGEGDRLYAFPEPEGEPTPAETTALEVTATRISSQTTTTAAESTTTATPTTTAETTTAEATTSTTTAQPPATTAGTTVSTDDDGATTTGGQPGFGVLAAVGAGAFAAWRRARRE